MTTVLRPALGLLVVLAALAGCGGAEESEQTSAEPRFATVAPADVAAGEVLLVDVREDGEWDAGHAPKALHVPLADVERRLDAIARRRGDRPVAFICRSGNRSAQAARIAVAAGLEDVINVDGGMAAWVRTGLPLVPRDGRVV